MDIIPALILAVTGLTVIVIVITAAFGGADQSAPKSSTTATSAPTRVQGQAARDTGMSRSMVPIRPQYLPALAQSRLLRLRTAHLSITTPPQRHIR